MERRGDYLYGTQSEISGYLDQQAASSMTSVALGGIALVGAGAIAAFVAVKNASKFTKEQNQILKQAFSEAKGDAFANKIYKRSSHKFFIVFLSVLFACFAAFGIASMIVYNITHSEGWNIMIESNFKYIFINGGVIFLVLALPILLGCRQLIIRKNMRKAAIKDYPKVICPHCGKKSKVLGFGWCSECFTLLRHLSREEAKIVSAEINNKSANNFFGNEIVYGSKKIRRRFKLAKIITFIEGFFIRGTFALAPMVIGMILILPKLSESEGMGLLLLLVAVVIPVGGLWALISMKIHLTGWKEKAAKWVVKPAEKLEDRLKAEISRFS